MARLRLSQRENRIGGRVILDRMEKASNSSERTLLLWDFLTKFVESDLKKVDPVAFDAISVFLPHEYQEDFRLLRGSESEAQKAVQEATKKKIDVVLLTVVLPELTAAKIALNIDLDREADHQVQGLRCWETRIPRGHEAESLSVVLSMVGIPRTTPCALACESLSQKYDVQEAAVLVGVAAGVEEKVQLGDVVASKTVFDYEGARVEETGVKKRPKPYTLKYGISMDLANYDPVRLKWHKHFITAFDKLRGIEEVPEVEEDWRPDYHSGVILSGEKLIADGSMQARREDFTEEMLALEMEASGFAEAWSKHEIPWIVFRGISDYGDQRKRGTNAWKATAALSAATAAVTFLSETYTRRQVATF